MAVKKAKKPVVSKKAVPEKEVLPIKKSRLSKKQKLIVAGGALVAIALLISARSLFIAAMVNGVPITRIEVIRNLEKQRGAQMLESMVNEKLIYQEARKANVSASADDVSAEVEKIKAQMVAQGQVLDSYLVSQGISQELFEDQIKLQLTLEKVLGDKLNVTDEEVNSFLEANKEYLPEMGENELKDLARGELRQQKLSAVVPAWLTELKDNSSIDYIYQY